MKRFQITMLFASLSLVYSLNAAEEIEKINAVVMLNIENGLANIQKGFLYNNMKLHNRKKTESFYLFYN